MRVSIWLTLLAAGITAAVVLVIGSLILEPDRDLLMYARFAPETISPNADGIDDVTEFTYEVTENAFVTLVFEAEDGTQFSFRERERRAPDEYRVVFSGVVDGFLYPGEEIAGEVVRRLIPDGVYAWQFTVEAQDDGETMVETGTLVVQGADNPLPEIPEFSVGPDVFTPNQDGVDDRVTVNVVLAKEAELNAYLVNQEGIRVPLPRREEGREIGEEGRHIFDYDGGLDNGVDPPPDGEYIVTARAQDDEGQVVERSTSLIIHNGGLPQAEIVGQLTGPTVVFDYIPYDESYLSELVDEELILGELIEPPDDVTSLNLDPITMPVGDVLVFKLTIENYGTAPLRTTGPPPGTVYEQTQNAAALGEYERSGVWRVGIQCETSPEPYPWRWAIGDEEILYSEVDPANGNVYYYLASGERSVIWGGIHMTELIESFNPQDCWAGLIHEDVQITVQNSQVGRRPIRLADLSSPTDNQ